MTGEQYRSRKTSELRNIVEAEQVRRIFITPADDPMLVQELYVDLLDTTADVVWVVDTSMVLFNPNVDSFEGARRFISTLAL